MKYYILIFTSIIIISCQNEVNNKTNGQINNINPDLEKLDQLIAKYPNDPKKYIERANILILAGNESGAINDLSKSIELDSSLTEAYYLRAKQYYKLKQYPEALQDLKRCYQKNKKNTSLIKMIAQIYLYAGKHKEAIKFSNELLKIDIHNADAYFIKGYAFKEMKDTSKSISTFQTALEQNPEMYNAQMQLGLIYSDMKNPIAIQYFNNAKNIRPDVLNPNYNIAMFYQNTGQYEDAKKAYRKLIELNNQYEKAYYNLGYVYLFQDSLDLAIQMFTLAIKTLPYYQDAYYNRGLCHEKNNNIMMALKDYKQSINLDPDHILANKAIKRLNNIQ